MCTILEIVHRQKISSLKLMQNCWGVIGDDLGKAKGPLEERCIYGLGSWEACKRSFQLWHRAQKLFCMSYAMRHPSKNKVTFWGNDLDASPLSGWESHFFWHNPKTDDRFLKWEKCGKTTLFSAHTYSLVDNAGNISITLHDKKLIITFKMNL